MLIVGLLLPVVLGLTLCWLVIPDAAIPECFALAYSLGFGFLTLAMFFLNILGFKFSLVNTTIFVSAIIGVLLVFTGKRNWLRLRSAMKVNPFTRTKQFMGSLSAFEKILVGLLTFFLLSHLVIAVYWPVFWSDSLTGYDLRAKLFFETQSFPEALAEILDRIVNVGYGFAIFQDSPMTSLVHTWLYLCGWASPKIFYPLLFISLVALFYHLLRDYVPRYHALLFTLVLVTTPYIYMYSTNSYPHFAFALYFSVGTFYLYGWIRRQKRSFLLLAGIFLGLSAWVRQASGIFFMGYLVIVLYVGVSRRRFFAPLIFSVLYFSIARWWGIYLQRFLHLYSMGTLGSISQLPVFLPMITRFFNFALWKEVLAFFWKYVLLSCRPIFYLLILSTPLYVERVWKHRFLFLMVLSNLILFLLGIYITILINEDLHQASARRLFLTFLPIIWYFIALITAQLQFSNGKSSLAENSSSSKRQKGQ